MNIKILLLLLIFGFSVKAQQINSEYLHVEGQRIVNSEGENVVLRGIGLGGYMLQEGYMLKVPFSGQQYVFKDSIQKLIGKEKTEEFYQNWRQNFIQKKDIDSMKKWGFNSVRLPMHYNLYTLPVEDEPVAGVNTWLEKGFQLTDSLISWCKANEMYLILDMHATPGGQGHDVNISDRDPLKPSLWEREDNRSKLIALWKKLAEKYRNETTIGAYDLINEPNWSFEGLTKGVEKNGVADLKNEPLKNLMVDITRAIREVDQNHIIIIEGNGWGNNYNGILPPWDDNMVLSFHKYWNYNTQEQIQLYLDYREKYNIPIWLGESGENSNDWFADAIGLMEKNNIGWCWWPLKKLGYNNPLQIKINPGYQNILEYWSGNAEKPSESEAYNALMQLAENTKIQNCIVHCDVVDAMIRQPHTDETIPFKKVIIKKGGIINAADYDIGKIGKAYHDNDASNYYISTGGDRQSWNKGRTYRNDGVDIYSVKEASERGDVYVGDLEEGEWMQYTFETETEGVYNISIRLAAESAEGRLVMEINHGETHNFNVPSTSGKWEVFKIKASQLKSGKNQLKLKVVNAGFDLQSIIINSVKQISK